MCFHTHVESIVGARALAFSVQEEEFSVWTHGTPGRITLERRSKNIFTHLKMFWHLNHAVQLRRENNHTRITDRSSYDWRVSSVGPPDGWPLASRLSCIQEQSHCPVPSAQHSADSSQIRSSKYDIHPPSLQTLVPGFIHRLKCPHITWWQSICSLFLPDPSHYSYTIRLSSAHVSPSPRV